MDVYKFPRGFLWGCATAAHQVEGNNINSDFWEWETKSESTPNSGLACNHYELYKKDFKLAKEVLNNNAHRLSIEWARIEPEEGKFSQKEIDHYKEVLSTLKSLNIKSMITLHHFTNPLWFAKKGGWEERKNVNYFKRYTELCAKEFGDLADHWITINEPNIYVGLAFIKGFWPPHKKNVPVAIRVFRNLALAHSEAYKIIHKNLVNPNVGTAINMAFFKSLTFPDRFLVKLSKWIMNNSFLALTKGRHDFIGINYYFIHISAWSDFLLRKKIIRRPEIIKILYGKRSDLGWPFYPKGIYEITKEIWNKYKIPIVITENGIADKKDTIRSRFILDHLTWLSQAIKEGVDIRGYFHWTLMDNIEWGIGKKAKFGLFETDYKTLERIPRKSAFLYGKIASENAILDSLTRVKL